jgi:hypothetical protein
MTALTAGEKTLKKRAWVYIHKPAVYEMHCDKCGGGNLEWSEYECMVWCYDCEIDTCGDGGVFAGPVALEVMEALGMSLDRLALATGKRMKPKMDEHGHVQYVEVIA